jgi:dUTP pyrophosphatase
MGWFRRKKLEPKPIIVWHVPEGRDDLTPVLAIDNSMAFDLISPISVIVPPYMPEVGVGSALINILVATTPPAGYGLIFGSRSSMANKGITVEAGWIDSDYRGLLKVLLFNHSGAPYTIVAGDRIAQARIIKTHDLDVHISYNYPDPDDTIRGAGGFGSTGK